jgi:drug/metabolite transporter (DMT)-like permease
MFKENSAVGEEGSRIDGRKVGLALVVGVLSISLAASLFIKADPTHALSKAGIRLFIACALLSPFVLRAWRRGLIDRRLVGHGLVAGLFYALHFGTWVFSLEHTSITASVTLVTATPLLLAIWSLISGKDRPELRHWIAIGLAFCGVTIITHHDAAQGGSSLLGDAMALLGAAGMAGYFLTARRLGDALDIWVFSGIATGFGAVALWITALMQGIPFEPASDDALFYLFLAALIPQLIGHTALTWVLRFKRPTIVGIATVGEPIGATLIGWLWLGLSVDITTAVGCLVTMTAVGLALYEPTR